MRGARWRGADSVWLLREIEMVVETFVSESECEL